MRGGEKGREGEDEEGGSGAGAGRMGPGSGLHSGEDMGVGRRRSKGMEV